MDDNNSLPSVGADLCAVNSPAVPEPQRIKEIRERLVVVNQVSPDAVAGDCYRDDINYLLAHYSPAEHEAARQPFDVAGCAQAISRYVDLCVTQHRARSWEQVEVILCRFLQAAEPPTPLPDHEVVARAIVERYAKCFDEFGYYDDDSAVQTIAAIIMEALKR